MKNYVSVTAAAFELKLSVDTIRRWEKKGLIKAVRDKNKHRLAERTALFYDSLNKKRGGECPT